jgi:hypothetical protein
LGREIPKTKTFARIVKENYYEAQPRTYRRTKAKGDRFNIGLFAKSLTTRKKRQITFSIKTEIKDGDGKNRGKR